MTTVASCGWDERVRLNDLLDEAAPEFRALKGLLIRVGIDQAYGGWNAPVEPNSRRFVYVPIPENQNVQYHPGLARKFSEALPWVESFSHENYCSIQLPLTLMDRHMHLDPDFDTLTYGDKGRLRGAGVLRLARDDLVAFYAGLRPTERCEHRLLYALIGLFVVSEVVWAKDVPQNRWHENAHTRKVKCGDSDVLIRAQRGGSGRLERCIPIGEFRDRAYRVRRDLLDAWGGLSVKNGYIHRSAVPPTFLDARRFYEWFLANEIPLLPGNN